MPPSCVFRSRPCRVQVTERCPGEGGFAPARPPALARTQGRQGAHVFCLPLQPGARERHGQALPAGPTRSTEPAPRNRPSPPAPDAMLMLPEKTPLHRWGSFARSMASLRAPKTFATMLCSLPCHPGTLPRTPGEDTTRATPPSAMGPPLHETEGSRWARTGTSTGLAVSWAVTCSSEAGRECNPDNLPRRLERGASLGAAEGLAAVLAPLPSTTAFLRSRKRVSKQVTTAGSH